ncbi:hypothetical protein A3750_02695 [Oleiphilus sp. HI0079]|uniref:sulfotransferase family protein n=1 Tax=unclassified Oleiphilus TaxID=2631174 RepID=UPI0007C2CAEC|nr:MULTISPECIES: sulfotransferase [unclassified Oleiphilus]KZY73986.1 hypothetical protein A3737_09070 [Oleiphilus sp. HI0065]KZY93154.1 hypothetical protein A3744_14140 [Oleiphilus sp. HI0073]KZZ47937.1 hypothetical protein A3760_15610 [Oleiphilus sp. HI0122]KZZ13897.1 hypothetical protein A3750_02695 [Oleiphilus sp. HI0079]KZZ15978.1 hypothetical protein A3751_16220 [Oleiphilus sp. HI0080]
MSEPSLGPLFIVASERSGTNLVRRRITESQAVYFGPSPIHMLKHLFYRAPYYGDLSNDQNFYSLVQDSVALAYEHFSPWDRVISSEDVIEAYDRFMPSKERTIVGVMHTLYMLYALDRGYSSYICKDNHIFDFAYQIALELPDARFLILYRDPRDVIASQLKRPSQVRNCSYLSMLWQTEQKKIIELLANARLSSRVLTLKYEEFVSSEASELKRISKFLDVELGNGCDRSFESESTSIQEWENLNNPTINDNFGKYKDALSFRKIRMIESILKNEMAYLGYKADTPRLLKIRGSYLKLSSALAVVFHTLKLKFGLLSLTDGEERQVAHIKSLKSKLD